VFLAGCLVKEEKRMTQPQGTWRETLVLAIGGGLGFWVANFAISLTPIAAEYRAALSIPYRPMLLEALLGGLIVGLCISYPYIRFFDRIPTRNALSKAAILSFVALVIVTMLIEVPAKTFTTSSDPLRYFLIGTMFNVLRILALGVVIAYLYDRLNWRVKR
jgi:NhaP-type Na+/H+ or K+/H+ antiporter